MILDYKEYAKHHTADEVEIFTKSIKRVETMVKNIIERSHRSEEGMNEAIAKLVVALPKHDARGMLVRLEQAASQAVEKSATQLFANLAFDYGNDGRIGAALEEYIVLQRQYDLLGMLRLTAEEEVKS